MIYSICYVAFSLLSIKVCMVFMIMVSGL